MRSVLLILISLLSLGAACADDIREFDVPTLEKLGNELSRRDSISTRGTDLVEERYPKSKSNWHGWITELGENDDRVYVILDSGSGVSQGYTAVFPHSGQPEVKDHHGEPLPPQIALRYQALQTARDAVKGKLYNVHYNPEVLNDPNGSGFLVYFLASTNKQGEILIGGHYRVTISADGSKAERVDLLSQLTRQNPDPEHRPVAIASTQLSSNVPVETWLYSNYLYQLPMYVTTKDGSLWKIVNGKIHKFSQAEIDAMKKK